MAKTAFINGSVLTPTYVASIYGTGANGGHDHDGVDSDGHAKKIPLDAGVTGVLSTANLPKIPADTGFTGLITQAGTTGIQTDTTWCVGVTGLSTAPGQQISAPKYFSKGIYVSNSSQNYANAQAYIYAEYRKNGGQMPANWTANTLVIEPIAGVSYTHVYAFSVIMPTNGSAFMTGLGMYFRYVDFFTIDAVVAITGKTVPWHLKGTLSGAALNSLTDDRAYAVPWDYQGGTSYPAGLGGASRYGYAVSSADPALGTDLVYIEESAGSSVLLVNASSVSVKMTGTLSVVPL